MQPLQRYLPDSGLPERGKIFADVDGDGDLDMLVRRLDLSNQNYQLDTADEIFLNAGDGSFELGPEDSLPLLPNGNLRSCEFLDVDGDNDVDLVEWTPNGLRLLRNDGTGRFRPAAAGSLSIGGTLPLLAADFDLDGDIDLVVRTASLAPFELHFLSNDGSGFFQDESTTWLPASVPTTLWFAAADFTGDGQVDLLGSTAVLVNDGGARFVVGTAPSADVGPGVVCDADNDGDLDIIAAQSGGATVWFNDGTGAFVSIGLPGPETDLVEVADVDLDGDVDVLLNGPNRLLENVGFGNFVLTAPERIPAISGSGSSRFVDLDGDGAPDILRSGSYSSPFFGGDQLLLNDGVGGFDVALASRVPVPTDPNGAVGDVDGDGDLDLFGREGLFLNDGYGEFAATGVSLGPPQSSVLRAQIVDVNGDGHADLMRGAELLAGEGAGGFKPVPLPPVDYALGMLPGDVDGDGDVDLVVLRGLATQPAIGLSDRLFRNDGNGSFVDVGLVNLPDFPEVSVAGALGDIDLDGDLDLITVGPVVGPASRPARLYLNDGTGRFADVTATNTPSNVVESTRVWLLDVDGDGAVEAWFGGAGGVWRNDGTGNFVQASGALTGAAVGQPVDLDDDGDIDSFALGTNVAWFQTGDGDFVRSEGPQQMPWLNGSVLVDVDGDDDVDLLNQSGRVLRNTTRQLHDLVAPRIGRAWRMRVMVRPGALNRSFAATLWTSFGRDHVRVQGAFGGFVLGDFGLLAFPPVAVPTPSGQLELSVPVPADPALLSLEVHAQVELQAEDGSIGFTNSVRSRVMP